MTIYSWGSAVLAATYHGLCQGCTKSEENGVLTGCPLLLQLWSYERLAVGRPMVRLEPYDAEWYEHGDEESRTTMGTLWLWRLICYLCFSSFTFSLYCYMHCYVQK